MYGIYNSSPNLNKSAVSSTVWSYNGLFIQLNAYAIQRISFTNTQANS